MCSSCGKTEAVRNRNKHTDRKIPHAPEISRTRLVPDPDPERLPSLALDRWFWIAGSGSVALSAAQTFDASVISELEQPSHRQPSIQKIWFPTADHIRGAPPPLHPPPLLPSAVLTQHPSLLGGLQFLLSHKRQQRRRCCKTKEGTTDEQQSGGGGGGGGGWGGWGGEGVCVGGCCRDCRRR